jgi:hypothetical protein
MSDELKQQLANALEIDPDQIMEYKILPGSDRYNVIDFNYRKFTNVEPQEVSRVPAPYLGIYQNPQRATKAQLLTLTRALDLDAGPKPTKKSLVALIEAQKVPQAGHLQAHDVTDWDEEE